MPIGAFTYTPDADFNGSRLLRVHGLRRRRKLDRNRNITVSPVNDPPVAVSGNASTDEDQKVTIIIATDIDSTSLTADCTGAAGGTVARQRRRHASISLRPRTSTATSRLSCTATDDKGAQTSSSATIVVGVAAGQ